ncbi:MAG: hypothetical protein JST81_11110 [Bacteroidetes bacterium]|nr:hypothetical protein [Bacteroidota bacterium]
MKRFFLMAFLVFSSLMMRAQSLDDIKEMINKSQFTEARTAIDKFLSSSRNSNDAEAWYYKGRIYNGLSGNSAVADSAYSLKMQAYDAFRKNQSLDSKDLWLKLEAYGSYLDLYAGFYDLGAKQFNAKNFEGAYNAFKKAIDVKDYCLAKKYTYEQITFYPLDTALTLNTAISATQANKIDEGVTYYRKLADANVAGKDYESIYEYLVEYYSKKNDKVNMDLMLEKGKKLYPDNAYWTNIQLKELADKKDTVALYAKYDEMLAKNPKNFDLAYGYAAEIYNSILKRDSRDADVLVKSEKLQELLKMAIAADTGIDATLLMVNHLFNKAADLLNASNLTKGNKPEDVKKKNELKAQSIQLMDKTIPYAEAAVKYYEGLPKLTPFNKANYKIMLSHLAEMYGVKNDAKKAAEYNAKDKAADKM